MSRTGDFIRVALGSALGLGLAPIAPGSFGALLGVWYHVGVALYVPTPWQIPMLVLGLIVVCVGNYALTPWAIAYWKKPDPGNFVLDEVAGYLVVPILFWGGKLWQVAVIGFLLFRIFDIIKLPGARYIDRNFHGPWGIVLDDVVSAIYAVLVLYGLRFGGVIT